MTRKIAAILVLAAIAAAALYYYSGRPAQPVTAAQPADVMAADHRNWVCPMHPEIVQDHPGTCPICGMKLVEEKGAEHHEHGVQVDSATVQRLGIRLASVKHATLGQDTLAYGNIAANENATYVIHTRYDGWIRKLHVHSVGEKVRAEQVIYEIYSPDMIARERTYLGSADRRKQLLQTIPTTAATESDLVMDLTMDAANDRVRLHAEEGVSTETIEQIEISKQPLDIVKISALKAGVITQINVREGTFVTPSMPLITLSDVSRVWVDITLFPDQASMVKVGDPVTVRLPDGQTVKTRLDFIALAADNNKVRARANLDNTSLHLRPGTYTDVTITAQPHDALVLPRSAILYSARGNMVMLSRGNGHFIPVAVETGAESGDLVELVSGLKEGAEVAVNGQFLLDAASSMHAAAERMHH